VQITGTYNYTRGSKELGVDLVKNPELALDPKIAVQLLIKGTMNGWYGRKLTDYVNATKTDYFNARRSVNGTDRAGMIAGYADQFEKALRNHPGV
jgi:predicted chitinase